MALENVGTILNLKENDVSSIKENKLENRPLSYFTKVYKFKLDDEKDD